MSELALLNYEQAAARIAVSVDTLKGLVRLKRVPHIRIGELTIRFQTQDLDQWIARGGAALDLDAGPRRRTLAASKEHEDAIDLLAPDMRRDGFVVMLRKRFGIAVKDSRVLPDAYRIDDATRTLTLYEVEHKNHLTASKHRKLTAIRDVLAASDWTLRLFAASSSSKEWTEIEVDTGALTIAEIARTAAVDRIRFGEP